MTQAAAQQAESAPPVFRGWIAAPRDAAEHLTSLGIKLGKYVESKGNFEECEASEEALLRLDPYFSNPYVWFFEQVLTQTLTVTITGDTVSQIEEALRTLARNVRQQPEGDQQFRLQRHVDITWKMGPAAAAAGEGGEHAGA